MIKRSSTLFMGGLGNMMFQAAMLYSYSKKFNYNYYLNYNHSGTVHKLPIEYKDTIFKDFEFIDNLDIEWSFYEEDKNNRPCKYSDIPNYNTENILFKGFFQSYKYFDDYKDQIQTLFGPNKEYLDKINKDYKFISEEKYVSLHIRRGDYVKLSDYHYNLSLEYYYNAIDYFDGYKFLVFSDDIDWCKDKFKGNNFKFIESESDIIDLYLMSLCEHNIIANSTFSWWGAYLNTNPNKQVIHPDKWFGKNNNHLDISDLFPTTWVCLSETLPKTTMKTGFIKNI